MNVSTSSIRLITSVPGPKSAEWMKRRDEAVPRGVATTLPVFVEKAEGAVIEDIDGNHFLDFTGGIGCLNQGHRPPAVVEAIREQADKHLHTCFMVTPYDSYVRLAEKLNNQAPGSSKKKTILLNTGAEAVENAIKIARAYTNRGGVIAFNDAFHGRTLLAASLTSKIHPYKAGFGPFAPEIYRMPYAYCYRCEYNLTYPDCNLHCARKLEDVFARQVASNSVAAVIFEPVLGEGGFVVPPEDWFQVIIEICRKHGVLVIADEVQTGFARTGAVLACEQFGFEPDLIVTAKSLSGGLPLGAVTGRQEIMDAPVVGGLGGTFGGNPLACVAGLAAWETLERENLTERAEQFGKIFLNATRSWPDEFPLIGDIRGVGAMRAIELVKDRITKEPAKDETKAVLNLCHQRGLLIISAGTYGNVIRILAPLVATDEQIDEGLAILEDSFRLVTAGAR